MQIKLQEKNYFKTYISFIILHFRNGVKIRELNVEFGVINVNCNESLLANKKLAPTTGPSSSVDAPSKTNKSDKKSSGAQSKVESLRKQIVHFPEKVLLILLFLS